MNPVFTLNYPELLVATYLRKHFPASAGYSTLIPLSAQQKGYDLAVLRRTAAGVKVATFQVKSSRTYGGFPGVAPRSGLQTFAHYMWLKTFIVPGEADFFVLIGQYATSPTSLKKTTSLWSTHMLIFTQAEMKTFMAAVRQKKKNAPDSHFGFGFDTPNQAYLTRGHAQSPHPDYSPQLLSNRVGLIKAAL